MLEKILPFDLSITAALCTGLAGCLIYLFLSWVLTKTPKNLPPGPRGWRATLKLLKASRDDNLYVVAAEWAREYGPLVLYYSMGHPMLLVNNSELSRKLLGSEEFKNYFCDRAVLYASKLAFYNSKDFLFTPFDEIMQKKRRLFHHLIGLYGEGVEKFEKVVGRELDRCLQEIEQHKDEDIDMPRLIGKSLKNVFYILSLGEQPPDTEATDLLEEFDLAFNGLLSPSVDLVLSHIPFLAKVPGPYKVKVNRMKHCMARVEELVYHKPKSTWVPGQPRGMADLLFDMLDKPGYEWMANDHEHVIAFLMSMFVAGHLNTRATVSGILLCFLNNPDITGKVQDEIDRVLGDRRPRFEDRARMPYTEACVLEILRLASQSALSAFRVASDEIQFEGYTIPKGAVVIINHWYLLHNEKIWEDPWSYKPERFLDAEGHILPADHPVRKGTLIFGIGPRSCPGEVFARSRVFLFITHVLQKFDLLPPVNDKLVPADFRVIDENVKGFVRQSQLYKARFRLRKGKTLERQ